ncbi:MAG: hypothetical protein ACTHJT_10260 [Cytophaga sp.]|uniref:hypothetical protein n=1 Tax=Cytophaga sp. TaxID=29535 RepID=UPI003F7DEB2A
MKQFVFLRSTTSYLLLFLLILCITLINGCSNNTPSEQVAATTDSVAASIDTAAPMHSTSGNHTTVPEDTIKALKIVYVTNGNTNPYSEMDDNTASGSVLSYASPLEVLEEYPEWYKVRSRNNAEIYIFYVFKKDVSDENPVALRLFFPAFQFVLKGFQHAEEYGTETPEHFYYQEGSEEESNVSKVRTIETDSIILYESMNTYDLIKHIKIVPKNAGDRFVVSLAYGQHISEVTDYTNPKSEQHLDKHQHWFELTPYKILPDTGGIFLPIGYYNITQAEEIACRTAMGKKYGLKDTSMIIPREYDITVDFVKKGRYYTYSLGALYLRVQRFTNGKLAGTRYIVIRQDESGC